MMPWGEIAKAVSGAVQSKANYNQAKTLDVGDYGHAASSGEKTVEVRQPEPENKQPEIKQPEESKEKDEESSSPLDAISSETAKDTTEPVGEQENTNKKWKDLSWEEKRTRINDVVNTAGNIMEKMKGLKTDQKTGSNVTPVDVPNYGSPAVSDGTLKNKEKIERLFQGDNAIDAFSKIDAYVYKYNQKAQNAYSGEKGVDDSTHFGPIAQDLGKNPVTSGTVHKDPDTGYLEVDTRQLTLTNTAMISQLARKIQELEERIGGIA